MTTKDPATPPGGDKTLDEAIEAGRIALVAVEARHDPHCDGHCPCDGLHALDYAELSREIVTAAGEVFTARHAAEIARLRAELAEIKAAVVELAPLGDSGPVRVSFETCAPLSDEEYEAFAAALRECRGPTLVLPPDAAAEQRGRERAAQAVRGLRGHRRESHGAGWNNGWGEAINASEAAARGATPTRPANAADIDPGDSHCTACGGSGLRGDQDCRARATPTSAAPDEESAAEALAAFEAGEKGVTAQPLPRGQTAYAEFTPTPAGGEAEEEMRLDVGTLSVAEVERIRRLTTLPTSPELRVEMEPDEPSPLTFDRGGYFVLDFNPGRRHLRCNVCGEASQLTNGMPVSEIVRDIAEHACPSAPAPPAEAPAPAGFDSEWTCPQPGCAHDGSGLPNAAAAANALSLHLARHHAAPPAPTSGKGENRG